MYYVSVNEEDLNHLKDSLDILMRVDVDVNDLYLYGIITNPTILEYAKEAISEENNDSETEGEIAPPKAIAIAIPISSDVLYYLTGSGLVIRKEDFVYISDGAEGVRSGSFSWYHGQFKLTLNQLQNPSVGNSESWIDKFLQDNAGELVQSATPTPPPEEVERNEGVKQTSSMRSSLLRK